MKRRISIVVLSLLVLVLIGFFWQSHLQMRRTRLDRLLIQAVLDRDAGKANAVLDQGADPNARDTPLPDKPAWAALLDGLRRRSATDPSALMIAALGGNTGTYWNWYNYPGMGSPTAGWGQCDQPAIVQTLLKRGADPDAKDGYGWTPLLCAAVCGNVNIARCLLDHGADVNERFANGETVLMDAARRGDRAQVQFFLDRGADASLHDNYGWTAITAASDADPAPCSVVVGCPRGSAAVIQLLITHGGNVNPPYVADYPTPLLTAIGERNPVVVQMLLAHGAHVNATDSEGRTPLMLMPRVLSWRDRATFRLLTLNGAKVNAASYDGNTALTWAADKDDIRTVRFLLAHGADVNAVNRGGHTALWFAANNGNAAMFNLLRSYGAKAQGESGKGAAVPVWGTGLGNYDIQGLR